jgi:hypothetical protein
MFDRSVAIGILASFLMNILGFRRRICMGLRILGCVSIGGNSDVSDGAGVTITI